MLMSRCHCQPGTASHLYFARQPTLRAIQTIYRPMPAPCLPRSGYHSYTPEIICSIYRQVLSREYASLRRSRTEKRDVGCLRLYCRHTLSAQSACLAMLLKHKRRSPSLPDAPHTSIRHYAVSVCLPYLNITDAILCERWSHIHCHMFYVTQRILRFAMIAIFTFMLIYADRLRRLRHITLPHSTHATYTFLHAASPCLRAICRHITFRFFTFIFRRRYFMPPYAIFMRVCYAFISDAMLYIESTCMPHYRAAPSMMRLCRRPFRGGEQRHTA